MTNHDTERLLHAARADQDARWANGECPLVESYLQRTPQFGAVADDLLVLIYGEILNRTRRGETIDEHAFRQRFPDVAGRLAPLLEVHELIGSEAFLPLMETAEPPIPMLPGYRVSQRVAQGGMSVVYRAVTSATNQAVAIKCLAAEHTSEPQALVRFLQEGELLRQLAHPHVVRLFEAGVHEGVPYLVTEWLEGGTLATWCQQGPNPWDRVAPIIRAVATALQAIHRHGIVHRDVKPANILFTHDGTVKLADFGIARRLLTGGGCTATGQVLGTLRYMPPEQIQGQHKAIGTATDIYALGAVMYELLTGQPPFTAPRPMQLLPLILTATPPPPQIVVASIPTSIADLVMWCLAKEPGQRPTWSQWNRIANAG